VAYLIFTMSRKHAAYELQDIYSKRIYKEAQKSKPLNRLLIYLKVTNWVVKEFFEK